MVCNLIRSKSEFSRRRGGTSLLEISLALTMLLAASVLLAQFLAAAAVQRRAGEERRLALQEVSNRMEQAMALPWEGVTADALRNSELGADTKQALGEPQWQVTITDEPAGPETARVTSRRIRLELSWVNQAGMRGEPVTLSAWRFHQEATP